MQTRRLFAARATRQFSLAKVAEIHHKDSKKFPLTKIVATIGPSSEQYPVLKEVVAAGLRIMRINFSHATYEEADLRTTNLRKSPGLAQEMNKSSTNLRAIMLDTQGPEIRTGSWANGAKNLELEGGSVITVTTDEASRASQTKEKLFLNYKTLSEGVKVDSRILIDDGSLQLRVEQVLGNGDVICRVSNTHTLGNKKNVNVPGGRIDLPALSDKDKLDLTWGVKNDVDFIAASFIRKASDVQEIKKFIGDLMPVYHPKSHPHPKIISKIESIEGLENFDSILAESDGIMVARGDLGVEIPLETLINVQKEIVRKCNVAGKPVVVATQMLESMQKNPRPTRAECADVANAVYDGADCVMLSGESAQGKYPVVSVDTMRRIVEESEYWVSKNRSFGTFIDVKPKGGSSSETMAYAAVEASKNSNVACIVVISKTGVTAAHVSKFRPLVPIVTFVPNHKVARLLQVYRGVHPVVITPKAGAEVDDIENIMDHVTSLGFAKKHENVVIVANEIKSGQSLLNNPSRISQGFTVRVATVL